MRTLVLLAAFTLLVPWPSAAQRPVDSRTTADAMEAMVRADYTKAATLLKPLVDNWTGEVSEAAAFFLAALYENGLGVPQDLPRACALYLRIEDGQGPFARLAGPLARSHMEQLGPDRVHECVTLASVGVNHGFAPARFVLDAEYSVIVDLSSKDQALVATVAEQGMEKRSPLQAPIGSGYIFLPIEHTALEWPRGSASKRHFIEVAAWVPTPDSRWQLAWSLSEIAGLDVVPVAEGTLTTITGDEPPSGVSLALRDLVALEVGESGAVEFAILDGADPTRERVPDVAERRESESELRKRRAADEKVNWKRRRDPGPCPVVRLHRCPMRAETCGSRGGRRNAPSRLRSAPIGSPGEQAASAGPLELASLPPGIDVVVNVFDRAQRDWSACSASRLIEEGSARKCGER